MSVPVRIDHCPLSLRCTITDLWKDPDTEKIYTFNTSLKSFRDHHCASKIITPPTAAFASKWVSKKTGNTRIQGPTRLEKSALIPPADQSGSARKKAKATGTQEWMFVALYQAEMQWEPIDVPAHYKEEFFAEFDLYVEKEDLTDEAETS